MRDGKTKGRKSGGQQSGVLRRKGPQVEECEGGDAQCGGTFVKKYLMGSHSERNGRLIYFIGGESIMINYNFVNTLNKICA